MSRFIALLDSNDKRVSVRLGIQTGFHAANTGLNAGSAAAELGPPPQAHAQHSRPAPPPLRLPAGGEPAAAQPATPFLAALHAGAFSELWLLQQGEAAALVRVRQSPGSGGSAPHWRLVAAAAASSASDRPRHSGAASGAQQANVGPAAMVRREGGAATASAPWQQTAAGAVPVASAAVKDIAAAGGDRSTRGWQDPEIMQCRWRVRLRDCIDAAPAVVATPAALGGVAPGARYQHL